MLSFFPQVYFTYSTAEYVYFFQIQLNASPCGRVFSEDTNIFSVLNSAQVALWNSEVFVRCILINCCFLRTEVLDTFITCNDSCHQIVWNKPISDTEHLIKCFKFDHCALIVHDYVMKECLSF